MAQVGLTSAGAKPRIRSNAPSPRQLGLFHAEDAFSLASIIVQGLTIGRMIQWLYPRSHAVGSVAPNSVAAE